MRDQGDIVGKNIEDIGRGGLNGEVRGVAFVWNRYLPVSLLFFRSLSQLTSTNPPC
jgi:hypothetical protein